MSYLNEEQRSIATLLHPLVEVSPDRSLFEFQKEDVIRGCVDFAGRKGVYLGHEMGCGKTIIAAAMVNFFAGLNSPTLVLCPKGGKGVWRAQLPLWTNLRGGVLHSIHDTIDPRWQYVICTYDLALRPTVLKQLLAVTWRILICDEAHQLGNEQSKRGKLVYGNLWDTIEQKILLLSGSITRNKIDQLWAPFRRIAPDVIPSYNQFVDRFCSVTIEVVFSKQKKKKIWTRKIHGAKNSEALKELSKIARANFLIRRLKKNVDPQLPEKTFQVIRVDVPNSAKKQLEKLGEEFLIEAINRAIEKEQPEPALATAYRELGLAKVESCVETTLQIFHEGNPDYDIGEVPRPLIVFVYHRDVYRQALFALQVAGLAVGGFPPGASTNARDKAEQDFQAGKNDIFLVSYSGSEAITLHRSSTVVIWELAWARFMNEQAWDRAHRLGQRKQVEVKILLTESEIDNKVYTGLKRKLSEHKRAFG